MGNYRLYMGIAAAGGNRRTGHGPACPEPDRDMVSTSHVERSNLSMRMHMRRFTRLTNAHSKKFQHHCHMVALYTVWYNYARMNSAVRMALAMAAGISDRLWDMADIVKLIDASAPEPKPRGPYRPRNSQHLADSNLN